MKSLPLIPGLLITALILAALCVYEFGASLVRTAILGRSAEDQEQDLK